MAVLEARHEVGTTNVPLDKAQRPMLRWGMETRTPVLNLYDNDRPLARLTLPYTDVPASTIETPLLPRVRGLNLSEDAVKALVAETAELFKQKVSEYADTLFKSLAAKLRPDASPIARAKAFAVEVESTRIRIPTTVYFDGTPVTIATYGGGYWVKRADFLRDPTTAIDLLTTALVEIVGRIDEAAIAEALLREPVRAELVPGHAVGTLHASGEAVAALFCGHAVQLPDDFQVPVYRLEGLTDDFFCLTDGVEPAISLVRCESFELVSQLSPLDPSVFYKGRYDFSIERYAGAAVHAPARVHRYRLPMST